MKRILLTALALAAVLSLSGCNPPEKKDETTTEAVTTITVTTTTETTTTSETTTASETATVTETTTGKVGGFIVYDEAPGADIEWENIGVVE